MSGVRCLALFLLVAMTGVASAQPPSVVPPPGAPLPLMQAPPPLWIGKADVKLETLHGQATTTASATVHGRQPVLVLTVHDGSGRRLDLLDPDVASCVKAETGLTCQAFGSYALTPPLYVVASTGQLVRTATLTCSQVPTALLTTTCRYPVGRPGE
jgi:hypothetical protein